MITELGQQIISLRQTGLSVKKISRQLGCSMAASSKWCAVVTGNENIIEQNQASIKAQRRVASVKAREMRLLGQQGQTVRSARDIWNQNKIDATRSFLRFVGNDKCQICGYCRCVAALNFHHIDPKLKNFELNGSELHRRSFELIIMEAKKCVLLCCLHHTEVHNGYKYDIRPLDFTGITIPDSVIEWYVHRIRDDPKFREKAKYGSFHAEATLDGPIATTTLGDVSRQIDPQFIADQFAVRFEKNIMEVAGSNPATPTN